MGLTIALLALLLTPAPAEPQDAHRGRLEARIQVLRVVDGDSLDVRFLEFADPNKEPEARCTHCLEWQQESRRQRGWSRVQGDTHVRLSGNINAPEGVRTQAKSRLEDLIRGADEVWLDIDDRGGPCPNHRDPSRDRYCRLLAVVWIRRGNRWVEATRTLLEEGLASITYDFPTEFDLSQPWNEDPERPAPANLTEPSPQNTPEVPSPPLAPPTIAENPVPPPQDSTPQPAPPSSAEPATALPVQPAPPAASPGPSPEPSNRRSATPLVIGGLVVLLAGVLVVVLLLRESRQARP